ncbi:penicillin-binding protein 2 [Pelagibius litoralis]|uniref:Penicillin-binding protein 2 n=1 Tax=Pelagibius litoralis TaxID=374515 RepID=A0A967C4E7_9PROT|nr:penicillin-binding protein 2 [Pelagibius litoralis]NIA68545.1 penicillin-binding protein 2 [Pelagibius litoralis]
MLQKNEDNERHRAFSRRGLLLGGAQSLLLAGLAGRMYYLQVVEADRYKTLAEDNRINLRLLPPPRGRILDRFGYPLASNRQNFRVVLVREQAGDVERVLDALSRLMVLGEHDYKRVLREASRKRGFVPVTVRENLTWDEVSRVEVNGPDLPGVSIEMGQIRDYPYAAGMSHVLGYVAPVAERDLTGDPLLELPGFRIGKNGIEQKYDLPLRGAAGNSQIEVNAYGRVIRELNREEGKPGDELVLTLDGGLQTFTHQRLLGEKSASAVVMDIENGDVLALASTPSYDPNAFNIGLTVKQWNNLINDPLKPLNNKATTGLYAPGSTFKMVVALAALKAGISPDHRAFCPGHMTLGRARFHCWKRPGHGWVDMIRGIQHSCDVFFYEISRKVGIDNIAAMARQFGLGEPVGIDLNGEKGGVIPTRDWKLANIGEPWQGGETLIASIGQGFVLTTPLQLAVMTARLASGKAVTPRLTRGVRAEGEGPEGGEPPVPDFATLDVPEAHLNIVREAMDAVSNHPRGTAYRARIQEEGWELAGKTGTSQVRRITMAERAAGVTKNEHLPWRRRDHALFVSFAPVHKPRYCCAVVVEHGGGGSKVAAPIARDLLIETQRRDPAGRPSMPILAVGLPTQQG